MNVLGINAYHGDASACIFINGKLIVAIEEERINRVKHSAGFPLNAINYCLKYAKIDINQIDHIAINRDPKQRLFSKILYSSKKIFKINFLKERLNNLQKIGSIKDEFKLHFKEKIRAKFNFVDHHIAHISSSIYFSNFNECNFISIDGFGDFASTIAGYYDGKKVKKFYEVLFPHSLGLFYTAITQYLGFKNYGDEYKVMGLAPYGQPKYYEKMKQILIKEKNKKFMLNLKYFKHHNSKIDMTWLKSNPQISNVYNDELIKLLGDERKENQSINQFHMDIASSAQKLFEDVLNEIANELFKKKNSYNLCLSGGCAMNSVANGKIHKKTPYKKIYIPPSPGDSGGAIGAAVTTIVKIEKINSFDDNPYLGPCFKNGDIEKLIKNNELEFKKKNIKFEYFEDKNIQLKKLAKKISENKIIGFFNDRMEWGPRALGNRSILADPRNKNIRDIINLKIKRRESFRPFAPSIIREFVKEWFEHDDEVPFMSKVFQVKNDKKSLIPSVVHVDGSGRLQTVEKRLNKNFYNLIQEFYKITGIPILLNTSFNENEPIVCKPDEALDCFLRTDMDCLSIESFLIYRSD